LLIFTSSTKIAKTEKKKYNCTIEMLTKTLKMKKHNQHNIKLFEIKIGINTIVI